MKHRTGTYGTAVLVALVASMLVVPFSCALAQAILSRQEHRAARAMRGELPAKAGALTA